MNGGTLVICSKNESNKRSEDKNERYQPQKCDKLKDEGDLENENILKMKTISKMNTISKIKTT